MKIELKNVKYAAFASQETACFEATIWIDGKRAGEVSNEGTGGCNSYYPRALEERIDAYAKTLPPVTATFNDSSTGKPFVLDQDADLFIGELLEDILLRKEFERMIKHRMVWVKTDGKMYNGTKMAPDAMKRALAMTPETLKAKIKDCQTLLNVLPRDDAFKLYKSHVA